MLYTWNLHNIVHQVYLKKKKKKKDLEAQVILKESISIS